MLDERLLHYPRSGPAVRLDDDAKAVGLGKLAVNLCSSAVGEVLEVWSGSLGSKPLMRFISDRVVMRLSVLDAAASGVVREPRARRLAFPRPSVDARTG